MTTPPAGVVGPRVSPVLCYRELTAQTEPQKPDYHRRTYHHQLQGGVNVTGRCPDNSKEKHLRRSGCRWLGYGYNETEGTLCSEPGCSLGPASGPGVRAEVRGACEVCVGRRHASEASAPLSTFNYSPTTLTDGTAYPKVMSLNHLTFISAGFI